MECSASSAWDGAEYLRRFNRRATASRVPLNGTFALTYRCNMRCGLCFVGGGAAGGAADELDTVGARAVIDGCVEAGCLALLLTGGEPMLRRDFAAVYRHARESGLLVTVFTNGTLVSAEVLRVFADLPPKAVEITLYGATEATYERITGIDGSHARCRDGIERLAAAGLEVRLKTILMRENAHEFGDMERMARDYGARFRFDACIFPGLDGNPGPLAHRVSPDEAVAADFSDPERAAEWRTQYGRATGAGDPDRLFLCGAGVTGFYVDPAGWMQSCVMVRTPRVRVADSGFAAAWRAVAAAMDAWKPGAGSACRTCDRKALCGYCPAFFELETGSEVRRSEYLCAIGQKRYEAIAAMR